MEKRKETLLNKIYYNPKHDASFGGLEKLYRAARATKNNLNISRNDVREWLRSQETYTLHKPVRKNYPRTRVFVAGIDDQFEADLGDFQSLSAQNDNYRFLLVCIDCFSKYAWVRAVKNKTGPVVTSAFRDILEQGRVPNYLHTDQGTEFLNSHFRKLMRQYGIQFFTTNSETKASIAERFIRTLKQKIYRYFTAENTVRYIDALQDIVFSYNHTLHRSIKEIPANVTRKNEFKVRQTLYGEKKLNPKFKFNVGDLVKISKTRRPFEKAYNQGWTEENFTIAKQIARNPPVYKIKDFGNEILDGIFYETELQKVVKKDDVYRVDSILRTRTRNGRKQYLVSWKNYPTKFNSWVDEKDITDIK
jgi:transposase InsO family protein